MDRFIYIANNYYDDIYNINIVIDKLQNKLEKNKLLKADRELLIDCLNLIRNLKKEL